MVVLAVASASALTAWGQGSSAGDIWSAWYGPALAGLVLAVIYRFIEAVAELRRTKDELGAVRGGRRAAPVRQGHA